jgi:ribosomal protein L40E
MKETTDTWICPDCGAEVKVGARGCPRCRARELRRRIARPAPRKQWQQDEALDGLDLPDEDFDYDDFVAREFGGKPHHRIGIKWWWWLTAAVLLACFIWWALGAGW